MRLVLFAIAVLAACGFLLTFGLESAFRNRAQSVQIVSPSPRSLSQGGQGYEAHGGVQQLLIDDPAAFLPGYGDKGVRLANLDYLRAHSTPIVNLHSIETEALFARIGCAATILTCGLGIWLMWPRPSA